MGAVPQTATRTSGHPSIAGRHGLGTYIVDFFCAKAKLVIEVDGDTHAEQIEYDAQRTAWLNEQKHYRVLRFTNDEVHRQIEAVIRAMFLR